MWSVGVILYILISGRPPFEGKNNEELYTNIVKGEFLFAGREWNNAEMGDIKKLIY